MNDAIERAEDDAARAFEALRAEVASLRRGIDLVSQQVQEAKSVDYSLTLGEMARALEGLQARLAAIEGTPWLAMTPAVYREQIAAAARSAAAVADRALEEGAAAQSAAARELREATRQVRTARAQRWGLAEAGVIGGVGGLLLWVVVIALLPSRVGDTLAVLPLGGGPWQAGAALMQRDSPASFDRMMSLYRACGEQATEQCAAAITRGAAAPAEPKGVAPVSERRR